MLHPRAVALFTVGKWPNAAADVTLCPPGNQVMRVGAQHYVQLACACRVS